MKSILKLSVVALVVIFNNAFSQTSAKITPSLTSGMYPDKNIIENLGGSKEQSIFLSAIKSADLSETLQSIGPFTVFAPANAAFNKLPKATLDNLMKPENKGMLSSLVTYHLVSGKMDSKDLMQLIEKGGGKAELITVNGEKLTVTSKAETLQVMDEKGGLATITVKDAYQSNGVLFVIDKVLMPK